MGPSRPDQRKERIHEEIAVSVDALYHHIQGRDGRRTDARGVHQGALSRFTKLVSDWFLFSVWYNPRCSLALEANQTHQNGLFHAIHVSNRVFC